MLVISIYEELCFVFFLGFFFFLLETLIQNREHRLLSYLQLFVLPALGS